jgi:gliding motility-associated-like protein
MTSIKIQIKVFTLALIGILLQFRLASQCTPPALVIDNLPLAICVDATPTPLVGYPSGGFFLINGNVVNFFDPAVVGLGNHAVTYFLIYDPACPPVNLTQIVTVNPVLNIQPVEDTITCLNPIANLSLTASGQVTNYQWFGPNGFFSNEPNPGVILPGDYFVVADNGACSASASVLVTENLAPPSNPVVLGGTIECVSNALQLSVSSDDADAVFNWLGPGGYSSDQQNPVVTEAGQYLVNIQNPDNGCIASLSVDVLEPPLPDLSTSVSGIINCKASEVALSMVSNTPNVTFSWLLPDGSSILGAQIDVDAPGLYWAVVEDAMGCKKNIEVEVVEDKNVPSIDIVSTDSVITCILQSLGIGITTDLPSGATDFLWLNPQQNPISNTAQAQATEPGPYSVVVTNLNNGCTASRIKNIILDTIAPVAIAEIDRIICLDEQGILQAAGSLNSGPASYSWESLEGNWIESPSSVETAVEFAGIYVLKVTDLANGCMDTDSVSLEAPINFPDGLTVDIKHPSCIGNNGSIKLENTANLDFTYNFQNLGFSSLSEFEGLPTGEYSIAISETGACTFDTIIYLLPPPEFNLDLFTATTVINQGETVEIQTSFSVPATEVVKIEWEKSGESLCNGCTVITDTPFESTFYKVYAETIDGCRSNNLIKILVNRNLDFYAGNVFAPDLDGINDLFIPQFGPSIRAAGNFQIYDRWGSLVFELKNIDTNISNKGWDGRTDGKKVIPGVYLYAIELEYIDGRKEVVTGDVTVLR